MKVIVSSKGKGLESSVSPVFGRAPWFVLVDTDDMSHESFENTAVSQSGGAGIQSAQFVLKKNPESVLSSNIGPNAFEVLQAGSVSCYITSGETVKDNIDAFIKGDLKKVESATVEQHTGIPEKSEDRTDEINENTDDLEMLSKKLRDLRAQVADILEQLDKIKEG